MIWFRNSMSNSSHGLRLSNAGVMGQQGSYNAPFDNMWTGTWGSSNYNTWTDNSSFASLSPIYRRTIGNYNPTNNDGDPTTQSYGASGGLFLGNNTSAQLSCYPEVGPTRNPDKWKLAVGMALRTLSMSAGYSDIGNEINDVLLYRDLLQDDSLRLSSDTLIDFMDLHGSLSNGQLVEIEDLLAIGNLIAAASHISAYSPTTTIDQNYKDYYQLYYKFMVDGELTGTHLSDLKNLSLKCPFIDGPVIFNARSLYNLATKSVSEYNDDECIFTSGERIASINKSTLTGVINYYLFPNPATEQLNIIGKTEKELIDIEIRDVTGKLVIKQNTKLTNYRTSLKLDLVNGIYFVTLINEYGESISKKMVIAK